MLILIIISICVNINNNNIIIISDRYYKIFDENHFTNTTRAAEYLSWMEKTENSVECSDTWFDVSAKRLSEYWECEGDLLLNWKDRGYKTLFDLLLVINYLI